MLGWRFQFCTHDVAIHSWTNFSIIDNTKVHSSLGHEVINYVFKDWQMQIFLSTRTVNFLWFNYSWQRKIAAMKQTVPRSTCKMVCCALIIVQMDLPVDGVCIRSPKNKTRLHDWLQNMNKLRWKPICHNKLCWKYFEERTFVISPSLARPVGNDLNSVMPAKDYIPTIFVKQHDAKLKWISSLMEKIE